jgi:hypothetical protein
MNEFIEKNSRLLRIYCLIIRTIGCFLLVGGALGALSGLYMIHNKTPHQGPSGTMTLAYFTLACDFLLPGLLAFVISQLLDYLIKPEVKAGLMLRLADKLCYCYAAFLFVKIFTSRLWVINNKYFEASQFYHMLFIQTILSIPLLAVVLVLIGAGVIIKRLLPVIDEAKTLV